MSNKRNRLIDGAFIQSLETLDLYIRSTMSGLISGSRPSKAYGSSMEWLDYKDYVPGDDLRRLDWNLVARFERYYTKYYADERQLYMHIYLDMSASMGEDEDKGWMALRLAAAIGYLTVANMDRVSYRLLRGEKCESLCENIMGKTAFYGAAIRLGELTFAGDVDIERAVRHDLRPGYDDGVSYLISDLLTESAWKKAVEYLLSRNRQVVLIHVLSPEEREPSQNGYMELTDAEDMTASRGLCMRVNEESIAAYRETVKVWLGDIRAFCASRNVVYLQAWSDESIEKILLRRGIEAGVIA